MEEKMKLVPLRVSPLIKLVRWSCLFAGVIHGFKCQRKYQAIEDSQREYKEKMRIMKEERIARERAIRNAADLRELEKIFLGTVFDDEETNEVPTDTKEVETQTTDPNNE